MAVNLDRKLVRAGPFVPRRSAEVIEQAKRMVGTYRHHQGFRNRYAPLLSPPDANQKLAKNEVPTYSLALAHAMTSGVANVCNHSTPTCRKHCNAEAGNGNYESVHRGRTWKVDLLNDEPQAFVDLLWWEIEIAVAKHGEIRVRLNTFSDLRWELICPALFDIPGVQFYDYTKYNWHDRKYAPDNYHLTYSHTERWTDIDVLAATVGGGLNVAMVFPQSRHMDLPSEVVFEDWRDERLQPRRVPVIDGDEHDDRTLDPPGVIVGLRAKGTLRTADNDWVVVS